MQGENAPKTFPPSDLKIINKLFFPYTLAQKDLAYKLSLVPK